MSRTTHLVKAAKGFAVRSFNMPDESRSFPKGKLDLVRIGASVIGRAVLEPGWRWSESVKPAAKTKTCETPHFQYHVSGTLRIELADGSYRDCRAGEVSLVPAGHDAWVIGNVPVVLVDFQGMEDYAKPRR